jgi:hypothetical protein
MIEKRHKHQRHEIKHKSIESFAIVRLHNLYRLFDFPPLIFCFYARARRIIESNGVL